MKKFIITFIICLVFISNVNAQEIENAKDLTLYLLDNFKYTSDVITHGNQEYVQRPGILEYSRAGDCDDFALYTWSTLTALNYKAEMYCFYFIYRGEKAGHAITVFLAEDNTYSIFSNQYLIMTNETDPLEAIKYVYPTWTKIHLWTPTHFGQVTAKDFFSDLSLKAVNFANIKKRIIKTRNEKKQFEKVRIIK